MKKKQRNAIIVIGLLALIATITMYILGSESRNLSELKDFWFYPIPLIIICILGVILRSNEKDG